MWVCELLNIKFLNARHYKMYIIPYIVFTSVSIIVQFLIFALFCLKERIDVSVGRVSDESVGRRRAAAGCWICEIILLQCGSETAARRYGLCHQDKAWDITLLQIF